MEYHPRQITVVVPYVTPDFQLTRAIESAASIHHLAEIILVNDGDSRAPSFVNAPVRVVSNAHKKGALGARLTGVQEAKTEYVCFLDSDDELESEGVETARNQLNECEAIGLAYGDLTIGDRVVRMHETCGDAYRLVLKNLSLAPFSGALFRVGSANLGGLNLDLPSWQDDAFFIEVSKQTEVCHVGRVVARMNSDREERISTSARRYEGLRLLLKTYNVEILREFGLFRNVIWYIRLVELWLGAVCKSSRFTNVRKVAVLLRRGLRRVVEPHFEYMHS